MGRKKKIAEKTKKKRGEDQERLFGMNVTEIVKEGDTLFAADNIRDAIKLYQMALRALNLPPSKLPNSALSNSSETIKEIKTKLFIAYATRAKELKDKKMFSEAKTMEKQAMESCPHPSFLNGASMAILLKLSTPEEAFKSYNLFYAKNGASSDLERIIAEIIVRQHCWDKVVSLDDDLAFKKDALSIKPAVELMDSGDWDGALECMKSLPRSSPFAHIRLFCRAMSAFYRDNDSEMLKAISMIPSDSMLIRITDTLKHNPGQSGINLDGTHKSSVSRGLHSNDKKDLQGKGINSKEAQPPERSNLAVQKCLWSGPFEIQEKADNIITLAINENYNEYLKKNILEFATLLMPTHIESVVQFVLETLCDLNSGNPRKFLIMADSLLKRKKGFFRIKRDAVFVAELFSSALEYFQHIDKEFPNPEEQKMAKAMIIHKIAFVIYARKEYSWLNRTIQKESNNAKLLGLTSTGGTIALLEMVVFALGLDPENRDIYDLALKIPSMNRETKGLHETILLSKCAAFPDDPAPCLELASLYHSKNAYRKAEDTLQKALELAPHDNRVMDQHVISLLISADKSANKKKFHLIQQDIEKAKQFDSKTCAILIAEKSFFYIFAETGNINSDELETVLKPFSLCDQLKCYALLMVDMEEKSGFVKPVPLKPRAAVRGSNGANQKGGRGKPIALNPDPYNTVYSLFKNGLLRLEELSSWDIFNLLLPLPKEWIHLFNRTDLIEYFSDNSKNAVLGKLEESNLLNLIERVDNVRLLPVFLNELENRTKNKKGKSSETSENKILEFYKITLKNIITSRSSQSEYLKLLSNLDPETETIIKAASKKLSMKATGRLKDALELFNFDILSYYGGSSFNLFDDDDDDDSYDGDNDDYSGGLFDDDDSIRNPFSGTSGKGKGGFDLFMGRGLPAGLDINSMPSFLIKMIVKDLAKMLNTPAGSEFRKSLDEVVDELEALIDDRGLRGKSDKELKAAKKGIDKEQDYKVKIIIINLCYKKEAMSKFSREAKTVFIE